MGVADKLLFEHGGPDLIVDWEPEPLRLEALIPEAFGPDNLT